VAPGGGALGTRQACYWPSQIGR